MDKFLKCLPIILKHEGGYVDHPKDPGGATNMGITHKTLSEWRKMPVTKEDVRRLTQDEAGRIYKALYWDKCRCDEMPLGVALVVFDGAVNSGVGQSSRWLQRSVGAHPDGVIGPKTLEIMNGKNPVTVINSVLDARLAFLQSLKTWPTFGKGWGRRVSEIRADALKLQQKETL